jgi:hypothetical protein
MKLQTVFESETYKEFKELRGPNWTMFCRTGPTANEIKEWERRQEDLEDVQHALSFLRKNLSRAAARGNAAHPIEVSLDYVYDIGASQDFYCALTGEDLEFERGGTYWLGNWCNPNSCTIDRIDSSKGYIKGNIQLITWKANCLKQHLDNDEFIEFCKDVAHYNK